MPKMRAPLACLLVCAVFSTVWGDDGLAQSARFLVRQLDGNALAERNEAEQKLVDLGPGVLPHLPEVTAGTPAEVKVRLGRIRTTLEQQRADRATQPTHLTLQVSDAPLAEVLEHIKQQTGNQVIDYRRNFRQDDAEIQVSLDWENVPFWQAIDDLLAQANLRAYHRSGQANVLTVVSAAGLERERQVEPGYSGIFRLQPTRIDSFRDLESGQAGSRLSLQVTWEPRVTVITLSLPLEGVRVVDDRGEAIELERSAGSLTAEVPQGAGSVTLTLNLPGIDRGSRRIEKLSGKLEALVPGGVEVFTFDNLATARNERQSKGDVEVTLQTFAQIDKLHDARVLVRLAGEQGALQSHRGWIYNNPVYLLGPEGERIQRVGFEDYERSVDSIGLAHKFVLEHEADQYQLVYETPASIVTLPLDFEITEIPLP
ncbi:MAG: hypothetical protein WEE51_04690 [Pirellulaceae bacterium]